MIYASFRLKSIEVHAQKSKRGINHFCSCNIWGIYLCKIIPRAQGTVLLHSQLSYNSISMKESKNVFPLIAHSNSVSYFNLFSLQMQHVHNRTHYFLPYSALHPAFCTSVNGITILIIPSQHIGVMVGYFFTFIIHIQLNINKLLVFLDWCSPCHSIFSVSKPPIQAIPHYYLTQLL